ncbi:MAG: FecR family protein [Candidatus Obscuribacterales bacterium]|nr:FecR family protein [Candidatus Obscuribacterales bacterium]
MNAGKVKVVSTFLTVILISGGGLAPVVGLAANLPVGDTASIPSNSALLKQAVGSVMRAEMIDESKQLLGEAMPAKVNDLLSEGSVIGTGARSWAELKWTSVTSRIWQNSVVQIRPSKRSVYLQEGGLTFNLKKDRPDKAPYDIRTKVLQARIHGTTVQVLAHGNVEKISVLEGNIDVRNLQNGSVVHLTPGVVYEVQVRGVIKTTSPTYNLFNNKPGTSKAEPVGELPGATGRSIAEAPEIRLNPRRGELIFQDSHTRALAYTANSKAILEHPLIGGSNPIPSIDLIEGAIGNLPTECAVDGKLDRVIAKNFKISRVPSRTSYAIGPNVGEGLPLPQVAMTDNAPSGKLENVAVPRVITTAPRVQMMVPIPVENPPVEEYSTSYLLNEPERTNGDGSLLVPEPLSLSSAEVTQERILPVVQSDAVVGSPMPVFTNPISSSAGPLGSILSDRRSNSEIVNLNVLGSRN